MLFDGPKLITVEKGWNYGDLDEGTTIFCDDDNFIMPGIHDNHVFFSGWLSANCGIDLTPFSDFSAAVDLIAQAVAKNPGHPVYAHGWDSESWSAQATRAVLDGVSTTVPITVIDKGRTRYWMNTAAVRRYGFSEGDLSAEKRWRLIREMTSDETIVGDGWHRFQQLLLSRGVVSCKDIVFDDCSVHELIDDHVLDVSMYVESVSEPFDVPALVKARQNTNRKRVRFGGAKVMVDGVVADGTGDIYGDYVAGGAKPSVDYHSIGETVARLSEAGISCCLTAEGDKAIDMSADILSRHHLPGTHHSMSDLEMITERASKVMAKSGITAEIYPQILGLNPSKAQSYMGKTIKGDDGGDFYRYTNLTRSGTTVTCGTDCPLFITSVPDSLFRATRRRFDENDGNWFPEYAMSAPDLLKAWSREGVSEEQRTLASGKPATFTVFDRDLISADDDALRDAKVIRTVIDGNVAYQQ
ncbi:MAG: amidohydrolase family protein [Bifidobacterium sp.]|nr:amidohydrolase family protein [Bifidobacterium sp.]